MVASRQKKSYKVTSWRDYNQSLVNRGDITFWFDETVVDVWEPENGTHDGDAVEPLLNQIESDVQTFYVDGANDQMKVYGTLKENEIWSIIPPRKNAIIQQHGNSSEEPLERDECLRQIRRDGKAAWKESIGYHKRSLAATAMSRIKSAFGDRIKNREPHNHIVEAALRCKLLNWFVALGMPLSIWS